MLTPLETASASAVAPSCLQRFNATVLLALFVFVFLYCVDITFVIIPWLSYSAPGALHLAGLTATTFTALYCFFRCMSTDPGRVPEGWTPDAESNSSAVQEVKKKGGAPRFCQKCNQYKPPRAHHCRVCNRCVLRMDHHCPWVNNCIGHANYKAFFLLLVYASAALLQNLYLLLAHAVYILQHSKHRRVVRTGPLAQPVVSSQDRSTLLMHAAVQTLAIAISIPVTIAVVMLLSWHVQMALQNKTTIEYQEGVTAQIKALTLGSRERHRHPYDIGACNNLHAVFGENECAWCLPRGAEEGGLQFPTVFDSPELLM